MSDTTAASNSGETPEQPQPTNAGKPTPALDQFFATVKEMDVQISTEVGDLLLADIKAGKLAERKALLSAGLSHLEEERKKIYMIKPDIIVGSRADGTKVGEDTYSKEQLKKLNEQKKAVADFQDLLERAIKGEPNALAKLKEKVGKK